ncbi:NTP/NDP exchange transporter [Lysobacter capsici]|uniref:NTP/NDP exchange transporter n=1 Tax=Lysobacter capsici TaxID=435897 RepID=UPI001BFFEB65|nr:MFS transporter [Lysobacter capsici]QWF18224.1 MFS transporter [Lysobacter capsici]
MSAVQGASLPSGRVHSGEWRAVAFSVGYFFCVLTAYYVIRPLRDQLSGAVGSTQLPWFYLATFIATLALTPVFSGLVSRYPRRVVVPLVYGFFIVCLLAFMPLFGEHGPLSARALGTVFFVWISVFNLFVVSVFWSFMTDIWSEGQARRLFPVIAVGGTVGSLAGPVLTRVLVDRIGVAPLLMVSAALLGLALVFVTLLGQWSRVHGTRRHEASHEAAIGGGMLDGLKQIFSNPFMASMALLLLLGDWIGTVNYGLVVDYSKATFTDAVARTRFAADLDLMTNIVALTMQVLITPWLLSRRGAASVIGVWSVVTVAFLTLTAMVADAHAPLTELFPAFGALIAMLPAGMAATIAPMPAVAITLVISRGLAYGMVNPARESLFTSAARTLRYKGKNAVDTAFWRFGDVTVATTVVALRSVGVGVAGLAGISAAAAAGAGVIGWRVARWVQRNNAAERRETTAA